jgi:beta-lactamase regulating signal transducer with metallopeptidase domain
MIGALINHLWQSTLCVAAIGLLTLTLRQSGAHARHGLWLAASLKFLVPFALLASLAAHLGAGPTTAASPTSMITVVHQIAQPIASDAFERTPAIMEAVTPTASMSEASRYEVPAHKSPGTPRFKAWAATLPFALWAIGFLAVIGFWGNRWMRIRAAVKSALPLDVKAPVPVVAADSSLEPGLVGILRPVLLLPKGIMDRLTAAELQAIMAHEVCHLRRRDNLTALCHMLVEAVFWFYPLVWWIGARLIHERERACDEAVVMSGNDPMVYAESILKVCRFYVESPVACASGVTGSDLKQRIEGILSERALRSVSMARRALIAAVLAVIGFGIYKGTATIAAAAPAPTTASSGKVLVLRDAPSWNRKRDFEQVLTELGMPFEVRPSADMAKVQLNGYNMVVIPGWQVADNNNYYKNFAANAATFDKYVSDGGTLVVEMNGAEHYGIELPGGANMVTHAALDNLITVTDHPIFAPLAGKPRVTANLASHGYIADAPAGALILMAEMLSGQMAADMSKPTFVEYSYGKGRVLAAAQCFHDQDGSGRGPLMPTLLKYAAARQWIAAATVPREAIAQAPAPGVKVDPAVFDQYAGYYRFEQGGWITHVSREGNRYFARIDAQEKMEIFPDTQTDYFARSADVRYTFEPAADGVGMQLRMRVNSENHSGQRMDDTVAKQSLEALDQRIKTNSPGPGTEAALRRQIGLFETNTPDYGSLSQAVGDGVRTEMPVFRLRLTKLGAMQSMQFQKVAANGMDAYDVMFEHGVVRWWIKLDDGGKVVALRFGANRS